MFILICFCLIILSSFYSSYETAFYASEKQTKKTKQQVLFLLNIILMGNATVRVLFSEISGYNLEILGNQYFDIHPALLHILIILLTSIVLVIFGESIPLNFGITNSNFVIKNLNWFIKISSFIFWPVVKPLTYITNSMVSFFSRKVQNANTLTEEEVRSIIQISYERDVVNPHEKQITDAIINLYSQAVSFYMIPRREVPIFDLEDSIQEAWQTMKEDSLTQIVIQNKSIDNIEGYLSIEDIALLPDIKNNTQKLLSLKHKIRTHVTIPESKRLIDAIMLLKSQKRALGIVIDEYGGFDGVITLNRLLGSLLVFEDAQDFDTGEKTEDIIWMTPYKDGIMVNPLRTTLRMVLEYFGQEIEGISEEDWSISRLILKKLDRFPKEGEDLQIQNLYFKVFSMQNHAINKVYISLVEKPQEVFSI